MDNTTNFKDYTDLMTKLTEVFSDLQPEELRDILFFLQEFKKGKIIPEDALFYVTYVFLEALEVVDDKKISEILIDGIEKYTTLNYPKRELPPVVVVKSGFRHFVVYGEVFAIEAYIRRIPLRAIVIDIQDNDAFEIFKFDELKTAFLIPLIQSRMKKK